MATLETAQETGGNSATQQPPDTEDAPPIPRVPAPVPNLLCVAGMAAPKAVVTRHRRCVDNTEEALAALLALPDWARTHVVVRGRKYLQNRETCMYGRTAGLRYYYSGVETQDMQLFPEIVTRLCGKVEAVILRTTGVAVRFNFCLLNLYRDERTLIGWHSDDERSLDRVAPIASLSLGATRKFELAGKRQSVRVSTDLCDGDVLVMWPPTQTHYTHCIKKQSRVAGVRVSLTFRVVVNGAEAGKGGALLQ